MGEADEEDTRVLSCAHFCLKNKSAPAIFSAGVRNNFPYLGDMNTFSFYFIFLSAHDFNNAFSVIYHDGY